jgi:NAD(P)H-hydrate epimerase
VLPLSWPPRDADHLLVSSAQMAALEQQLFASGLPVEALMEKAALALSQRLLLGPMAPELRQNGALVLVGPGHNGGDGLVIARELHLAGVATRIWCPYERLKPLTAAHLRHALWLGIPRLEQPPLPADPALWIDALFGIGQTRRPDQSWAGLENLLAARQQQRPGALVAVDVPTGLCADSGERLGSQAACAGLTATIGLIKQGLVQDQALAWVGELERIDLGLPAHLLQSLEPHQPLGLRPRDAASAPWPRSPEAAGKYQRGRLLVIAGSPAYPGAAQLCLAGASASGCGSLRAAVPAAVAQQLWSVQPHVVLSASLGGLHLGGVDLGTLPATALERLDAVALGPGLGPGPTAADGEAAMAADHQAWHQLQRFEGLLLLDADGLNRLAQRGQPSSWLQGRRGPSWITPHRGEFDRLFPELVGVLPLEAAAAAAQASGCAVVLKGARTVVASPDGCRWQLLEAEVHAARAGLGDVLAGYAAGRAARAATGDAVLLAAAALEHAAAGLRAVASSGLGGGTPMTIATALAHAAQAM